ncbi:MAG: hypothetical protein ACPGXK_12350 [Phycisphaerae bacterium]
MNDGLLVGKRRISEYPDIDCFASFHNVQGGDSTTGDSNAVFVDGHVEFVNYRQPEIYAWNNPETGATENISATVMWCTDRRVAGVRRSLPPEQMIVLMSKDNPWAGFA